MSTYGTVCAQPEHRGIDLDGGASHADSKKLLESAIGIVEWFEGEVPVQCIPGNQHDLIISTVSDVS